MDIELSVVEVRVLGCLLEKESCTPDYYPLTLTALVTACNQKSNRNPGMLLDERDVVRALENLREEHHLATRISMAGSRVAKYAHAISNQWELTAEQCAVLCELFLRGPQTVGELRTHCARMYPFDSTDAVLQVLNELVVLETGAMVTQLPLEAGRREPRWAHLLCGEIEQDAASNELPPEPALIQVKAENERLEKLEVEVEQLREQLQALQEQFTAFRQQFE